ncbi:MAG: FlgD immunoglobulin-like domain containing protein, partial [Candidatus Cloacimonadota bacterium]|nr:FlgD immunoglobulin-like domain containing protein [Candidatus Cloacimonadota bacterium]
MKKVVSIFLATVLIIGLFGDVQKKGVTRQLTPIQFEQARQKMSRSIANNPPEWVMETTPVDLVSNYYDYMPGSFNKSPIRVQPNEGGVYMQYHGKGLVGSNRRIWSSYVEEDGNVVTAGTNVSTFDMWEGYPGMDIDPTTGNPFVAWHVNFDNDSEFEIAMTYDRFNIIGAPGLWQTAEVIYDNSDNADIPTPHPATDNFIWPQVELTESPVDGMTTRIWVMGNNSGSNNGNPASNVVLGFADFHSATLMDVGSLSWNWTTIPVLDSMSVDSDNWDRAFISLIASDDGQKVALVGYTLGGVGETAGAFVLLNENYGEGAFTYYHTPDSEDNSQFEFQVPNPLNEFEAEDGTAFDHLCIQFINGGHFSANFTDSEESKILFSTNVGLTTPDEGYYPSYMGVKSVNFDLDTYDFRLNDITPIRYNDDGTTLLPNYYNDTPNTWWDIDEDGIIDETYEDIEDDLHASYEESLNPYLVTEYPIFHPDVDNGFYYNNTKIAVNKEHNLVATIWSDGTKSYLAEMYPDEAEYQSWAGMPEIAIAVSPNGGNSWSEPLKLNANSEDINEGTYIGGFIPELDGMSPTYVYPSETIDDVELDGSGDYWGTIHLMFLDDYVYGVDAYPLQGGMMKYMSIRVNFTNYIGTEGGDVEEAPATTLSNFPNPFNPATTINFTLANEADVKLHIYNVLGQKVRQFDKKMLIAGHHSIVWNGTNQQNKQVGSGIYFYR